MTRLRFKVLGPLEFYDGTCWATLPAPKWRAVLALLLISQNQVVATEQIIDELWGDDLPVDPVKAVQVYISRVRKSLNDKTQRVLLSQASGYQLVLDPVELDAHVFNGYIIHARGEIARQRPEIAVQDLRAALALYRGPALVGVPGTTRIPADAARLEELRRSGLRAYIDARFILGETHGLIADLRALTAEYPLDEGLWARLMLVLAKMSRQGDALEVFAQARDTLIGQLGVEPGDELRQAQSEVLNGVDSDIDGFKQLLTTGNSAVRLVTAPVIPRQLPPAVAGFVGRLDYLRRLDAMRAEAHEQHSVALNIAVITGVHGIGKTAMAVHWAQSIVENFPDGQLFASLLDRDGQQGVPPAMILRQFIRAICPSLSDIPEGQEERTAQYRSLLAEKRVLVVLDNAKDAAQVRPLLPGCPECFVVVTSRYDLAELVNVDGARALPLGRLDDEEAAELVRRVGQLSQIDADPSVAAKVVAQCCGRPLELRQAANGMTRRDLREGKPQRAL
jgi:DNA-binding SARP family transcriptional activator